MQIQINDTYRIDSDPRTFYLQKRAGNDKDGNEAWNNITYHADLPQVLESYFKTRCRTSEAKGFQEAADEIKAIYREVKEMAKALEFRGEELVRG